MATSRKARDAAEELAEMYRQKGERWKAREWTIQLRAVNPEAVAEGEPASVEAAEEALIAVTLSSEAPVARYDWWSDESYIEILDHTQCDLSYARDGLPFCLDHCSGDQIGLVEQVRVNATDGTLEGMVRPGNHPDAEWVFADIRAGIRKKVSLGYAQGDYTEEKRASDALPVRRFAFMPLEGSSVCIPADYEVGFLGRSLLGALRSTSTPRPNVSPTGQEMTMADKAIDTPPDGAAEQERQVEMLRQDSLGELAEQYSEVVSAKVLRTWQKDKTFTFAKGREFIVAELGKQSAAIRGATGTGAGGPDADSPDNYDEKGKRKAGHTGSRESNSGPFRSLGEQLSHIVAAGQGRGVSESLVAVQRSISGAGTALGSDGSFAIQKDFAVDVLESAFTGGAILSQCDVTEVGPGSDGLEVVYLDETSRATGSRWGGIQIYRGAEADAATAKKPKVGKWESRLEDLIGVAYLTERLMQDAPAMADVFQKGFASEFQFVTEDEIIRGNGAGQMYGILNSGATVSTTKETGQVAATIVADNIMKMWTRVTPRARLNGQWYINCECDPQLQSMMIGTGVSGQLVYMAPGGLSGAKFGTIYGRPVVPIEQASGLGTVGDIFFADFGQYKVVTKGGLKSDESIHVRFLNNERTLRWVTRVNGAPKARAPITPYKATDTNLKQSAFVTLATRS